MKTYDKEILTKAIKESNTWGSLANRLGISYGTLRSVKRNIKRYGISTAHFGRFWKVGRKRIHPTIEKQCPNCGTKFETAQGSYREQFFCSKACASLLARLDEYSPFRWFLTTVKRNAKFRKLEVFVSLENLKELWDKQKGICPYTGLKMELRQNTRYKKFNPKQASLDRIDSSAGYIKGNIQFVCLFINYGKNKLSDESVKQFIKDIRDSKPVDSEQI